MYALVENEKNIHDYCCFFDMSFLHLAIRNTQYYSFKSVSFKLAANTQTHEIHTDCLKLDNYKQVFSHAAT